MKYSTFKELYKDVSILGDQQKCSEALNLLKQALENFPTNEYQEHFSEIEFAKATLSYECGMYEEYIQILTEIIGQGFAYPQKYLNIMPVSDERFLKLKEKNLMLLNQAQKQAKLEYEVHLPEGYNEKKKYPLFLALHGNGGNIKEFSDYWKPNRFTERGFIFAYVQSSQIWWHNGYGWTKNLSIARKDIQHCYDLISQQYLIDSEYTLIGGFSGGAIASLDITMANVFPVNGFVLLCPGLNPESFTKEKVVYAALRGVKGVLMEGELLAPVQSQEEMISLFREVGLQYKYIINKGIGHWFPDNLSEELENGLRFILE
ncbi:MAG: hypothetical protein KAX49_18510 [Halanaerobiales bacterium]|nr:hypothetical protein [Halanaerobiales bacterium]